MVDSADPTQHQLGWYMRNCMQSSAAGRLESVLLERLGVLKGAPPDLDEMLDLGKVKVRRALLRELRGLIGPFSTPPPDIDSTEQNVLFARHEFGLDEVETEILLFILRYERNKYVEQFADEVAGRLASIPRAIAILTGTDPGEVLRRIAPGGVLITSGLLTINQDGRDIAGRSGYLQIAFPLRKSMFKPCHSREEWADGVFGEPLRSNLVWADYAHLGEVADFAAAVLTGAAKQKALGVNILIHGPVGTGKTEFCKTLAARCGLTIWSVGETDDQGGEPTRLERLASLRLAQHLVKRRAAAVILFDEAEDVLAQDGAYLFGDRVQSRSAPKVHLNRVLEQNSTPILWTCNDLEFMDPAVLRRMTLVIELRTPNRSVRTRLWERALVESQLGLDAGAACRLARRYEAPPAVAANAVRAAALAGGGEGEIALAVDGVLQVLGSGLGPSGSDGAVFDLNLIHCDEDLGRLVTQLSRPRAARNWSLCLYGPPGTGKSQFARHLAERIGIEIIQQRASDLLSKWVGQSEKQIAKVFADARAQNAMLVFDEVDSLLSNREEAVRSWEVTQVNEMLTWMESHPLPFVCTTNLIDRLDRASLRRFTFKLRFDPLTPAQSARAFERFFGMEPMRALPEGLTSGDFVTVKRKRDIFGAVQPEELVDWLSQELQTRGARPKAMGFVLPKSTGN